MKLKITLTSFFLFLSFVSFAQLPPVGHLTLFSENGDKFFLILNGEQQNDIAQTNLRVEELNQPYYSAQIVFADKTLEPISKNYLPITDADGIYQDVTYKIKRDKNKKSKMKMNFFSMIPVRPEYVAPSNVYVVHYGQPQGNVGMNANVNVGVNMNVNMNVNETVSHDGNSGMHNGNHHNDHDGHNHGNNNHQPRGCGSKYAMSPANFNSALATLKKQSFDDSKLKTAQQVVSANCVSTGQIIQMADVFGFEENKLALAKFAYDYCTDPENYFKLNGIFSFSSNADDLSEYVQGRK